MFDFRLRFVTGGRKKWSAGGETAGTEPERNAAAGHKRKRARLRSPNAGRDEWAEMTEGSRSEMSEAAVSVPPVGPGGVTSFG